MGIRQDQLNGYSEKSGNKLHEEWFEQIKNKFGGMKIPPYLCILNLFNDERIKPTFNQ